MNYRQCWIAFFAVVVVAVLNGCDRIEPPTFVSSEEAKKLSKELQQAVQNELEANGYVPHAKTDCQNMTWRVDRLLINNDVFNVLATAATATEMACRLVTGILA